MTQLLENDQNIRFNQNFFKKKAQKNYRETIFQFKKVVNSFFVFNLCFLSAFFLQITLFISLVFFKNPSIYIAILLASIFLSIFSYLIMYFYFQSKKPKAIALIKNSFIEICKKDLSIPVNLAEHHLTIALATLKLSNHITKNEKEIFRIPRFLNFLFPRSLYKFLYKEDLFKFKEALLTAGIEEHLHQIKLTPSDLEIHCSLANTYTNLSLLYLEGKHIFKSKNIKEILSQKYLSCLQIALEEYKILNDYAPNDPWIHLQLAKNYEKLNMKNEQISEYVTIFKLCPNDNNILFNLGNLYFETKQNSKGLRIYEELKLRGYKKADQLLEFYSIYKNNLLLQEQF